MAFEVTPNAFRGLPGLRNTVTNRRTTKIVACDEEPGTPRLRAAQFRDTPMMADMRLGQPPRPLPNPGYHRPATNTENLAELFSDKRNKIATIQPSRFGRP